MKILVVDENLTSRMHFAALVQEADPTSDVILADGLKSAIEKSEVNGISCVFTEFYLSGLSGGWLVRYLRTMREYKETSIYIISELSFRAEEALQIGADGFFDKRNIGVGDIRQCLLAQRCHLLCDATED